MNIPARANALAEVGKSLVMMIYTAAIVVSALETLFSLFAFFNTQGFVIAVVVVLDGLFLLAMLWTVRSRPVQRFQVRSWLPAVLGIPVLLLLNLFYIWIGS